MFLEALLVITKTWTACKCSSTCERRSKLQDVRTLEFCPAIKKEQNINTHTRGGISEALCKWSYTARFRFNRILAKLITSERKQVADCLGPGPDGIGEGGWRRRHCFRERTIVYLDRDIMVTHLYIMVRIHPIISLKWMDFILCRLETSLWTVSSHSALEIDHCVMKKQVRL